MVNISIYFKKLVFIIFLCCPFISYCQEKSSIKFEIPKVELIESDSILLLELKNTDTSISKDIEPILFIDDTEVYINFPGGVKALNRYLKKNITYPDTARMKGFTGVVLVSFFVDKSGTISDVKIEKGVSSDIDKEVIRVVSIMPNWVWDKNIKPRNRKYRKVLQIKFSLN